MSICALLATMVLGFAACQPQNQPNQPNQTQTDEPTIVGEWALETISEVEVTGTGNLYHTNKVDGWYYIFSEDKSFVFYQGDEAEKGTYTLIGTTLVLEWNGSGQEKFTVLTLTQNTLVLKQTFDGSEGWVEYNYKRTK